MPIPSQTMRISDLRIISLSLLSLSLISPTFSIVTDSAFLFHICSTFENFTANSPFASNLKQLSNNLAAKSPQTGFAIDSIAQNSQNQIYGLALCRGDVSSSDCKNCIVTASQEIQSRCPYRKGAVIWYDFCLFKYSDLEFFGKIDNANKFYMWNVQEIGDSEAFNDQVRDLITSLSDEVVRKPNLYAIGEKEIEHSKKLYGLVQCTRDLSSAACKKCLDDAIGELPSCCNGKIGGRVVGGSCNFRYELYPIVDEQK